MIFLRYKMWDNRKKKWDKSPFFIADDGGVRWMNKLGNFVDPARYFLSVYSGYKDKDDKEIYTGDVCTDNSGLINLVVFESGCFSFLELNDKDYCQTYLMDEWFNPRLYHRPSGVRIIGNMYESPEFINDNINYKELMEYIKLMPWNPYEPNFRKHYEI